MKLEKKNHSESGNPDPKRQILYAFTFMWVLAFKSLINRPICITTEVRYKVRNE
jgi:hypothetical protein